MDLWDEWIKHTWNWCEDVTTAHTVSFFEMCALGLRVKNQKKLCGGIQTIDKNGKGTKGQRDKGTKGKER